MILFCGCLYFVAQRNEMQQVLLVGLGVVEVNI